MVQRLVQVFEHSNVTRVVHCPVKGVKSSRLIAGIKGRRYIVLYKCPQSLLLLLWKSPGHKTDGVRVGESGRGTSSGAGGRGAGSHLGLTRYTWDLYGLGEVGVS